MLTSCAQVLCHRLTQPAHEMVAFFILLSFNSLSNSLKSLVSSLGSGPRGAGSSQFSDSISEGKSSFESLFLALIATDSVTSCAPAHDDEVPVAKLSGQRGEELLLAASASADIESMRSVKTGCLALLGSKMGEGAHL